MKILHLGHFFAGAYCDDIIRICTENIIRSFAPETEFFHRGENAPVLNGLDMIEWANKNVDLIIFGGGSLLGRLRLAPFDRIEEWSDKLQIPLVLFAPGWRKEEIFDDQDKERMDLLLRTASHVGVRGFKTLETIKGFGLPYGKVEVVGDPVLSFEGVENTEENPFFAGNVRVLSEMEIAQDSATPENGDHHKALIKIWNSLLKKYPSHVLRLFSFSDDSHFYAKKFSDFESGAKVIEGIKDSARCYNYRSLDIEDLVNHASRIKGADLVLSHRLHPQILGIVQGAPTIPVEYQFGKVEDCLSVGMKKLSRLIIPAKDLSVKAVSGVMKKIADPKLLEENRKVIEKYRAIQKNFLKIAIGG